MHVNHLNSVIKKNTGKSTSVIIHDRMVAEAKALLRNTSWNVAEIAYALGFAYPSHFNKYFKKFTEVTPLEFRMNNMALSMALLICIIIPLNGIIGLLLRLTNFTSSIKRYQP